MEHKIVDVAGFKFDDGEAGVFTGYGSTFGNVDLQDETVEPGAFAASLKKNPVLPLLWSHDTKLPIGDVEAVEDKRGLRIQGRIVLALAKGRDVYTLMKRGIVKSFSIGYRVLEDAWVGKVRHLKKVELWEISAVLFPANPKATLGTVKGLDAEGEIHVELAALVDVPIPEAVKEELAEFQTWLAADLQLGEAPTVRYLKSMPSPRSHGEHIPLTTGSVILIRGDLGRDDMRKAVAHEFLHDAQHTVWRTLGRLKIENSPERRARAEGLADCYASTAWSRFEAARRAEAASQYASAYRTACKKLRRAEASVVVGDAWF